MLQLARLVTLATLALRAVTPLCAADSDRDFSGRWDLDRNASDLRSLSSETYEFLGIQQDSNIHCTAIDKRGTAIQWTYLLNGEESKYQIGADSLNSVAKWEGAALLINTLVSGPQNYAVMDRWTLSRDHSQLIVQRQISRGVQQVEGRIVYGHFAIEQTAPPAAQTANAAPKPLPGAAAIARSNSAPAEQPALASRPTVPPPPSFTVPAGTHVLLSLSSTISTRNSKEGDRVYLETAMPVAQGGRIVIPRGSYVQATITKTKPAGRLSSKGELYLLFDSLTLPNGVSRDFRARLTSADASKGSVDPNEGKISGDTGQDPHKVATGVGIGSMGGVIVGSAAGHPITGLGVGAAAGLATVLLSKNKDVVLQRGTSVEMVLDRDLYYTAAELRH
jgi:type IV secretion system protein VirB10